MSATTPEPTGSAPRIGLPRLAAHTAGFAALWWVLAGGGRWGVGLPVVVAAVLLMSRAPRTTRLSITGLLRFVPFFFWHSLRGGIDVAARALNPRLPIHPAIVDYEMQLDTPASRVLMANTVTLLPGTLSAELSGNRLSVHVLNASSPVADMLETLERRIAAMSAKDSGAQQ